MCFVFRCFGRAVREICACAFHCARWMFYIGLAIAFAVALLYSSSLMYARLSNNVHYVTPQRQINVAQNMCPALSLATEFDREPLMCFVR